MRKKSIRAPREIRDAHGLEVGVAIGVRPAPARVEAFDHAPSRIKAARRSCLRWATELPAGSSSCAAARHCRSNPVRLLSG